ncbi:MAG: hypothetical protein Q9M75_00555, partial [Ghiorsea sp.]|nr:hypothetical protein [Ghiorsea sp.]
GFSMTNCYINGSRVPDIINASYYEEDGLILSFCNNLNESIALKLGKKCCVKISNLRKLRKIIDKQVGVKGIMGECKYTEDHNRSHFLKSNEDSWQHEYRMFWRHTENQVVTIPKGFGKLVTSY